MPRSPRTIRRRRVRLKERSDATHQSTNQASGDTSIGGGLLGVLLGNVDFANVLAVYCAHALDAIPEGTATIAHHGIPGLVGLEFGLAAIAVDDLGTWGASQIERIVFE